MYGEQSTQRDRVSGITSLQRAYQKKLQIFSSLPNTDQQMLSISPVGLSGVAGVANNRLRVLASHQCGPGLIPGPDAISGLSFCWFSSLLRGFFSRFSGFPPSPKTNIQLIPAGYKLCSKVTHGPYSGCQRCHCKLWVRPCLSCVVAVLCNSD